MGINIRIGMRLFETVVTISHIQDSSHLRTKNRTETRCKLMDVLCFLVFEIRLEDQVTSLHQRQV